MKNKIHAILLLVCSLCYSNSKGQYAINIKFKNIIDTVAYFRIYTFDEKLFLQKDTIKISDRNTIIQFSDKIYGGAYYLYFPQSKKRIGLCIENLDRFNLVLDGKYWNDSIFCSNKKNTLYIQYQLQESKYKYLDSQYIELQKKGAGSLKTKEQLYKGKKDALMSFRVNAMKKLNSSSLLFKYFNVLNILDKFSPNKYDYNSREIFINTFQLNDIQLYFSPFLKEIIYEYLSSFPLQADSLLKGTKVIMSKINCKDKAYPNTFNYIASVLQNNSIKNNVKGYTSFIETYLIKSKCQFLPKNTSEEFISNYNRIKPLTVSDTATNIILKDTLGNFQSLYSHLSKYDYTVISFFDPTCEHCKIQLPQLDSTLNRLKKQTGLKILNFTICNTSLILEKQWKEFILEKNLNQDYIHVIMGEESQIRKVYAAYSNPMFFLCDNNGKMLLKKTNISEIRKMILQSSRIEN